jgi:hypothetical protein
VSQKKHAFKKDTGMTKFKIAYWSSTGLLSLMYFGGALMYLTQHDMVSDGYVALGYPAYLITVLIVAKILGPVAILWRKSIALSDLAYAGMFYHLLLALSAHLNAGDGGFVPALIGLVLLPISFFTQNYARSGVSPYAGTRLGIAA